MRDLTAEVLNKLKPSWATHYRTNSAEVLFESENRWCAIGLNFPFIKRGPFKQKSKLTKCKPIPPFEPKPFDITQHELDNHLTELESGNLGVNDCGWIIDKESAIAIARHFKLTADDLK